ncbi:MAG: IS66 family transposase [Pseudomonadota bacterium]
MRCGTLEDEVIRLRHQVAWFQRQIFGQKSERRIIENNSFQGTLGYALDDLSPKDLPSKKHRVQSHDRQSKPRQCEDEATDASLFFDESKVPIETIILSNPDTADLAPEEYEIIGEKVSYRLAQRPGSYVVLKYIRPVIKKRDTQIISCPPAPVSVIDGSRADVSLIAGLLVDKFAYHLPLYRQHQRLLDAGFKVSRPWLTQLCNYGCSLLEAIYLAQFNSVRASRVKAMDETPIQAGQAGPGQLQKAYFWPVYGERDEVCFPFFTNRNYECVEEALGLSSVEGGVLLSDGYGAYDRYADKTGIIRAQCWSHARRKFFKAQDVESEGANQALDIIGAIYQVESRIREQRLTGIAKRDYRQQYASPLVEQFFTWIEECFAHHGLLPSNPFIKALAYALKRQDALKVYLNDPDVPIDTNHLERALRPIPMGRKNWLFAWTELGAKHIGIIQSLITTCRLHHVDPYTYLVDVLQRISSHPQRLIEQLTPRLWKQHFADNPLRSDLDRF